MTFIVRHLNCCTLKINKLCLLISELAIQAYCTKFERYYRVKISQILPYSHWQLSVGDLSQFHQFLIDGYLDDI